MSNIFMEKKCCALKKKHVNCHYFHIINVVDEQCNLLNQQKYRKIVFYKNLFFCKKLFFIEKPLNIHGIKLLFLFVSQKNLFLWNI